MSPAIAARGSVCARSGSVKRLFEQRGTPNNSQYSKTGFLARQNSI